MVEKEVRMPGLEDRLNDLGVKTVLFDLDDTLIDTYTLFDEAIMRFLDLVAGGDEKLKERFWQLDKESYSRMAVNPNKWNWVADRLGDEFIQYSQKLAEARQILLGIYDQVPVFHDGVEEVLRDVYLSGVRMGIVTHANKKWSELKWQRLGLDRFVKKRDFFVVDENGFKDKRAWAWAIMEMGVNPGQVMVVGDNLKGDIIASGEVGVRHRVWVKLARNWSVYTAGELPAGVGEIGSTAELVEWVMGESM